MRNKLHPKKKVKLLKYSLALRIKACVMALLMVIHGIEPTSVFALSGGPSAPEFSSFTPAGVSDMVDPFTGDFKYNIPLLDIDGYPVNLSYSGNVGMEEEASWVGLGWNLNPGMVNRTHRGVPDDFSGEEIIEKHNLKKQVRFSLGVSFLMEAAGFSSENATNFLKSVGLEVSTGAALTFSTKRGFSIGRTMGMTASYGPANLGLSKGPDGIDVNAGLTFGDELGNGTNLNLGAQTGYNSRSGFQNVSFSASLSETAEKDVVEETTDEQGNTTKEEKTLQSDYSISGGASQPLIGKLSYFPNAKPKSQSFSFAFAGKIGGDLTAVDGDLSFDGMYWQDDLKEKEVRSDAYGYNYLPEAEDDEAALLDYNTEGNSASFSPEMSVLPVSALMYDMYNVVGQGFSGKIRPIRSETGAFHDPVTSPSFSPDISIGAELATGNAVKVGLDGSVMVDFLKTKPWEDVQDKYGKFDGQTLATLHQNLTYITGVQAGQMNESYYSDVGGDEPKAFKLSGVKNVTFSGGSYSPPDMSKFPTSDPMKRISQDEVIRVLSNDEAAIVEAHISAHQRKFYTTNSSLTATTNFDRSSHSGSQIGEITAYKNDGSRYVYAVPVRNTKKLEVQFNASGEIENEALGLIEYDVDDDSNEDNENGSNHLYYSKEIPSFSYGHLLTEYLAADYVDVGGDGVTPDDLGTAVKFNWRQTHSATSPYKWRSPMTYNAGGATKFKASFNRGSRLTETDQMASYSYGEKEMAYLHSIEGKNHIAFFEISERKDGQPATGTQGGVSTSDPGLYKLDKIILYSRTEYEASGTSAVPIKTIKFNYDYSLCKGVINHENYDPAQSAANNPGKLTLLSVQIWHGNDETGALSPYEFTYSTSNPTYHAKHVDRWGKYKSENPDDFEFSTSFYENYPYVHEESSTLSEDYEAWQLVEITLPTGGDINVSYEPDEYRYVQDKKATKMLRLLGVGTSDDIGTMGNKLYNMTRESSLDYSYLFFDTPDGVSDQADLEELINFDEPSDMLYFNIPILIPPIDAKASLPASNHYEYVRGYCEPLEIGFVDGNQQFYVKIAAQNFADKGKKMINPILKAALDYMYANHQTMLFGGINPEDHGILKTVKNILAVKDDILAMFLGPYGLMIMKQVGKTIMANEMGMVRFNHPEQRKVGGGLRVASIKLTDNWSSLTGYSGDEDTDYAQYYNYDYPDGSCSGVATYEPSIGNDENPFKQAIQPNDIPKKEKTRKPRPFSYQEGPIGEMFYPAPTVGYAHVTITTQDPTSSNSTLSDRTVTTKDFYTAKDFPLEVDMTDIEIEKTKLLIPAVLATINRQKAATSQGFSIVLNDMHGKPKRELTQVELLSGTMQTVSDAQYVYHTDVDGKLNNTVQCVDRNGGIADKTLGVTVDVDVYSNDVFNEVIKTEVEGNVSFFMGGPVPITIPPIWGSFMETNTEYHTTTVTKVIQKVGILKEVHFRNRDLATTKTNELFDEHTGKVLWSSTTTEYHKDEHPTIPLSGPISQEDKLHEAEFPVYFHNKYDRMGHAFRNLGAEYIPDESKVFLTADDVQNQMTAQDREALKEIIYRGYIDGLNISGSPLYNGQLSGNQVPEGIYVEGDEVLVMDNEGVPLYLAYVSEVVNESELQQILDATGSTADNPLGDPSPGQSGGSSNSGSTGNTNTQLTLCNDQAIEDEGLAEMYTKIVNMSSTFGSLPSGMVSAMAGIDVSDAAFKIHSFLYDLGIGHTSSNSLNSFYTVWNQPWSQDLHEIMKHFLSEQEFRDFMSELNSKQAQNDLLTVLRCSEIRSCLNDDVSGNGLLQALDFMTSDMTQQGSFSPITNLFVHSSLNYTTTYFAVNHDPSPTTSCDIAANKYQESSTPCNVEVISYEQFYEELQTYGFTSVNPAPTYFPCAGFLTNNGKYGFVEYVASVCTTKNYVADYGDLNYDCENVTVDAEDPDDPGDYDDNGGNNVVDDDQDYDYDEPDKSNLVMFVDADGDILDLEGKRVRVIRSGRRNLHSTSLANMAAINDNPFNPPTGQYVAQGYLSSTAVEFEEEWSTDYLHSYTTEFNPFVTGHRGIYRPFRNYAFRGIKSADQSMNTKTDGFLEAYVNFWTLDATSKNEVTMTPNTEGIWVTDNTVTKFSRSGQALESYNPLGFPSAQLVNEDQMVVASAVNAAHTDILFEPFELLTTDAGVYRMNNLEADEDHVSLQLFNTSHSATRDITTDRDAHSGNTSLWMKGSKSSGITGYSGLPDKAVWTFDVTPPDPSGPVYDQNEYVVRGFRPRGKKYVISMWVKTVLSDESTYDPTAQIATLIISADDDQGTIDLNDMIFGSGTSGNDISTSASGPMIDGWRRIEAEVILPDNTEELEIQLIPDAYGCYVDDFRVYPAEGNMTTYVYDASTMRLRCILDENNYGMFYRYNADGTLQKIEKETLHGRITVQEGFTRNRSVN